MLNHGDIASIAYTTQSKDITESEFVKRNLSLEVGLLVIGC